MPTVVFDPTAYAVSWAAIPTLITTAAVLMLGVLILISERRSSVRWLFFLTTLTIAVWLFAFSFMYCARDERLALWWAKAAYLGVPLIPVAIYHFTLAVLGTAARRRAGVAAAWLIAFSFQAAILTTGSLINHVRLYAWGAYPQYEWLSVPYLLFFFGLLGLTLREYHRAYRQAKPGTAQRERTRALMIAFLVVSFGSVDYLAKYGIPCYPFGYMAVLGFVMLAARAVWRYRLVDLTPAFAASQILETMQDAVFVTDLEGKIRVVNRSACRLLGSHETAIFGLPLERALALPSDSPLRAERLLEHGAIRQCETVWEMRGGQQRHVSVSASVVDDGDRGAVGIVFTVADITARTQAQLHERALAEANKRRAVELHDAYDELQRTQAMLIQAEKMSAVGQLASGIAHEVKNPLSILLQSVNYLEQIPNPERAQQMEILQMMRDAVKRADAIIRGLLDFSRPAQLALEPTALGAILKDSLTLIEQQMAVTNIAVTTDVPAGLPLVPMDRNAMKQVFINLLLNAVQAMPQGGRLTLRARSMRLTAQSPGVGTRATDPFRAGQEALRCTIEDTGAGIPGEILSRIFEPFFTTKPPGEGVGLGLPITRTIIERHRGLILIDSSAGRGTTVTVMLPTVEAAAAHEEPEPAARGGLEASHVGAH